MIPAAVHRAAARRTTNGCCTATRPASSCGRQRVATRTAPAPSATRCLHAHRPRSRPVEPNGHVREGIDAGTHFRPPSAAASPPQPSFFSAPLFTPRSQRIPAAAALKNPVAATPASLAAGKKAYDENCAGCHGHKAAGCGKGRRRHLDHPGAGRQAAARPDRRPVGPRLDRRRDLHGHQEGRAADDDGGLGRADLGHRNLEHRATTCARSRRTATLAVAHRRHAAPTRPPHREPALQLADYVADADHRRARRREHARRSWRASTSCATSRAAGASSSTTSTGRSTSSTSRRSSSRPIWISTASTGVPACSARLTFQRNFATGLINVVFDPDYPRNGVFYTIHMEDPTIDAPAEPKPGVVPASTCPATRRRRRS